MELPNLSTKQWTSIFIVVVVLVVLVFFFWLYGAMPKSLSREEIIKTMSAQPVQNLNPEQRLQVVQSMTARQPKSSLTATDRERIIQSMTASPAPKK